jgi:hypothetical protein
MALEHFGEMAFGRAETRRHAATQAVWCATDILVRYADTLVHAEIVVNLVARVEVIHGELSC